MVYCDLCDISIMLCDRMCSRVHRLCHLAVSQQFAKRILRWRRPPPAALKLEKERDFERGRGERSFCFISLFPYHAVHVFFYLRLPPGSKVRKEQLKQNRGRRGEMTTGKREGKTPKFQWVVSSLEVFQPTSFFSGQKYFISPFERPESWPL